MLEPAVDSRARCGAGACCTLLVALEKLAYERRRDGADAWGVFEDTAEKGRFLETFSCRVVPDQAVVSSGGVTSQLAEQTSAYGR